MQRSYLKLAAILGMTAVLLGAFGAHFLKKLVDPEILSTYQTGVSYQVYHSLALMGVGIIYKRYPNKWMMWAGRFFVFGIILFSGSLYLLSTMKAMTGAGLKEFGLVTPVGGLMLVVGWICIFFGIPSRTMT